MASFNKVILIGNLTRDPELRYTPKGMAIAKIGLAVNRTWRNEQRSDHRFLAWDCRADGRAQYRERLRRTKRGSSEQV